MTRHELIARLEEYRRLHEAGDVTALGAIVSHYDDIIAALRDDGWRPIETYDPLIHNRVLITGRYANGIAYVEEGVWRISNRSWVARQIEPPTHWRPLPDSPDRAAREPADG